MDFRWRCIFPSRWLLAVLPNIDELAARRLPAAVFNLVFPDDCRVCGSPLLSRFDFDPASYGLPLGALDDDPGVKPAFHVFVAHKAPWFEITDGLKQYPELPKKAS